MGPFKRRLPADQRLLSFWLLLLAMLSYLGFLSDIYLLLSAINYSRKFLRKKVKESK
ncbi:uncharacterized protein EURHEDRAFT_409408 [Aspergillus ruber CBS 135680]|uniref:Uncharacterized protein n=1 Tax=Aspergillus ruber (strain CBS 135680) TaxID=1388766 RepID=A0A017SPC4_ASPRC|nr:uncharacterized protein EURHEDRAFT_409408 [Aspergillus ruber CBS 135680]EYE98085.1 hypothetical protein EURHEDRAFT_409408 [Aspergillus ruber CBS 135680]